MAKLDAPETYNRFDPSRMRAHLHWFPQQCQEAWQKAMEFKLPPGLSEVDKLVVLGMGGSAIGADLARSLIASMSKPVFHVSREYDLPSFVDKDTLVIACSYSGNTEETISSFSQALQTPARKLAITTGGKLQELASAHKVPVFTVECVAPPRAALGYSLFPLLAFLYRAGFIKTEPQVADTVRILEGQLAKLGETVPVSLNPAKQLAEKLRGKLAVIYGAQPMVEVAHRWKTQFNENSKAWAFYEPLPELNHNAVVGYRFPREMADFVSVIMLRCPSVHPRNAVRYQITSEMLSKAAIPHQIVDSTGDEVLSQVMSLVFLGDWTSYYLAALYETDPTPVEIIDYLKRRLSNQK